MVAVMPAEPEVCEIAMGGPDGAPIRLETGRLGRQAEAAIVARRGDTVVYATLCLGARDEAGGDFAPLSIEYQERHSASGRTSNAISRRDGRPADKEILIGRLIDRPLRPTIVDGWCADVQIVATVLAFDGAHAPDILAILAASALLQLSRVPTTCAVGASRVTTRPDETSEGGEDALSLDATLSEAKDASLSMVVAGSGNSVLMVEGGANFVPEDQVVSALDAALKQAAHAAEAIAAWADSLRKAGKARPKFLTRPPFVKPYPYHVERILSNAFSSDIAASIRALEDGDMTSHRETLADLERAVSDHVLLGSWGRTVGGGGSASGVLPPDATTVSLPGGDSSAGTTASTNASPSTTTTSSSLAAELRDDEEILRERDGAAPATGDDDDDDAFDDDDSDARLASARQALPGGGLVTPDVSLKNSDAARPGPGTGATTTPAPGDAASAPITKADVKRALKKLCEKAMCRRVREEGKRCDGRPADEVRPITIDRSPLPTAHGSAAFTRGETQSVATCTLGSKAMNLRPLDALDEAATEKRFYLQYTFPPSSVGETGRIGAPGRREVGHGALAERALAPAVPSAQQFTYSMRVESLITESCGSSSMASVCGGCLAMLDAGVPVRHVAGVAMGVLLPDDDDDDDVRDDDVRDDDDDDITTTSTTASSEQVFPSDSPVLLTDILGVEDALGSMDFKVAGDENGISAFQLDVKRLGLTTEILADAVHRSRAARLVVLDKMKAAYPEPRTDLAKTVPRQRNVAIPVAAIGKLIGPGGRTVKSLIEEYKLRDIQVDDDGAVNVAGLNDTAILAAVERIKQLVADDSSDGGGGGNAGVGNAKYEGPLPDVDEVLQGTVTDVKTFGAFVALGDKYPGLEGLVHVSELAIERVRFIEKFIQSGQSIEVKVIKIDTENMKIGLSRKALLVEQRATSSKAPKKRTSAKLIETTPPPPPPPPPQPPEAAQKENAASSA